MKIKRTFQCLSLMLLLVSLLFAQSGALAAPLSQESGPYASAHADNQKMGLLAPTNIFVGSPVTYAVDLQNVPSTGYTSAEFICTYNQSLASVTSLADAGLFGTSPVILKNGPGGGTFTYAVSGSNGTKAMTSGTVFRFTLVALATGSFTVNCSAKVSTTGSDLMTIPFSPLSITVSPATNNGTVSGTVISGRAVTVTLTGSETHSVAASSSGAYSISAAAGTYTLTASAPGYLGASGSVTLTTGGTLTRNVTLLGGDINADNVIDAWDVQTLGFYYNQPVTSSTPISVDLNNDGTINLLDLTILANNYGRTGPIAW